MTRYVAIILIVALGGIARAQTTLFSWNAPALPMGTGSGAAGPGDLNGDGIPDVVFGAPYPSGGA